jgi:hypothetical protein
LALFVRQRAPGVSPKQNHPITGVVCRSKARIRAMTQRP